MNILYVSSHFGIESSSASNHATDRFFYLLKKGFNPYVITESKHNLDKYTIYTIEENSINIILKKLPGKIRNRFHRYFRSDVFAKWHNINQYEKSIRKIIAHKKIDLIISTGYASTHIAVSNTLRKVGDIPWVVELQDPLLFDGIESYSPTQRDMCFLKRAEALIKKSSRIICLTEACAEYYREKFDSDKVVHVYPIFNHTSENQIEKSKKKYNSIEFVHAGTLTRDRNLDVFLNSIKTEKNLDIKISLYGSISKELLKLYSDKDNVNYYGTVSREKLKEVIDRANVCIVVQQTSDISKLTIPCKLYDYLSVGCPVLYLSYKNDELRKVHKELNIYFADQDNPQEVENVISDLLCDYENNRLKSPNASYFFKQNDKLCHELSSLILKQ